MGRKPFTPTDTDRGIVMMLAGVDIPHERICLCIHRDGKPIDRKTLLKYFKKELETGAAHIDAKVMSRIYRAIDAGDMKTIMWFVEKKMWRPDRGGFRNAPNQSEHLVGVAGMPGVLTPPVKGAPLQIG